MEAYIVPLQDNVVKDIAFRLDIIVKLMAALFAREFSNIDAIVKLDRMMLSREQIANALGITTANVAQQLYLASKKTDKKADKKLKKAEGDAIVTEASGEAAAAPVE